MTEVNQNSLRFAEIKAKYDNIFLVPTQRVKVLLILNKLSELLISYLDSPSDTKDSLEKEEEICDFLIATYASSDLFLKDFLLNHINNQVRFSSNFQNPPYFGDFGQPQPGFLGGDFQQAQISIDTLNQIKQNNPTGLAGQPNQCYTNLNKEYEIYKSVYPLYQQAINIILDSGRKITFGSGDPSYWISSRPTNRW